MRKGALLITLLITTSLPVTAQDDGTTTTAAAWSAREVPSELVDTIINRNMFVPDQRRAPRAETPTVETGGDNARADEPATPVEAQREDPDRRFRLIGSSFVTGRWLAFIENLDDAETHRVAIGGPIANGTVTLIDYNLIEYTVNGETRTVLIGRDLTGAEPLPPSVSSTGTNGAATSSSNTASTTSLDTPTAAPSDADARRAEVLRQLRERRERESR